jgi:hypothetical protein
LPFILSQISFRTNDKLNHTESILNKLTTIHFSTFHEFGRELLLNLKDLIFSSRELSTIEFSLNPYGFHQTNPIENDVYSILEVLEGMNKILNI